MPLTIQLHTESSIPLEVDTLYLHRMREQTPGDIAKTLIFRGNEQLPCGDFFHITGSAAEDDTVVWQGNLEKVKRIAAGMTGGTVHIEGNAGMHLGAEMHSGEIILHGHAGDWLGAEMKGGRIRVHGNVGNLAGAVYRAGRRGMTGGEILVEGNAGDELGHTMRRGLIAVKGNVGNAAGTSMIAGTILIFGTSGNRHGAGMKRGTIAFCGPGHAPEILPTFKHACTYEPLFLKLYFKLLQNLRFAVPKSADAELYHRYCGDLLELGKGELLVPAKLAAT